MSWITKLFQKDKDIITEDLNKIGANLYDIALIRCLSAIGVNVYKYNFYKKEIVDKYYVRDQYLADILENVIVLCQDRDIRYRNHHFVFLQFLIKYICIPSKFNYQLVSTLELITRRLNNNYKITFIIQFCEKYISTSLIACLTPYLDYITWYQYVNKAYSTQVYDNFRLKVKEEYKTNVPYTISLERYGELFMKYRFDNHKENFKNQRQETNKILSLDLTLFNLTTSTLTVSNLKASYRKLVIIHHPDKGGTKEMFIKITDAYNRLLKNCK